MSEKPGNDTPDTPEVSETELREMKVDELRQEARDENISGTSGLRKEELVKEVAKARSEDRQGVGGDPEAEAGDLGAGPEGGKIRHGDASSSSLKYSQEVTSTEDEPEREGRSLATTHHEVIRQWAEERGGVPSTVEGTEHGDHLGVLRIDFGSQNSSLRHVSWEEWFKTFDVRRLNFIYQEQRTDGTQSNFFRLENPEREDA
jgi:Rho termination factor, N-terminal domain